MVGAPFIRPGMSQVEIQYTQHIGTDPIERSLPRSALTKRADEVARSMDSSTSISLVFTATQERPQVYGQDSALCKRVCDCHYVDRECFIRSDLI